jgi:hypothetical protein
MVANKKKILIKKTVEIEVACNIEQRSFCFFGFFSVELRAKNSNRGKPNTYDRHLVYLKLEKHLQIKP